MHRFPVGRQGERAVNRRPRIVEQLLFHAGAGEATPVCATARIKR
jgi:hypothetical protein